MGPEVIVDVTGVVGGEEGGETLMQLPLWAEPCTENTGQHLKPAMDSQKQGQLVRTRPRKARNSSMAEHLPSTSDGGPGLNPEPSQSTPEALDMDEA